MNELDHVQRGLIAMWQIWMQWFVWFYGAQVLLLWQKPEIFKQFSKLIAWMWISFSLCGSIAAIMVAHYTWTVGQQYPDIGFPVHHAVVAAILNAFPLLAVCVVWRKVAV